MTEPKKTTTLTNGSQKDACTGRSSWRPFTSEVSFTDYLYGTSKKWSMTGLLRIVMKHPLVNTNTPGSEILDSPKYMHVEIS